MSLNTLSRSPLNLLRTGAAAISLGSTLLAAACSGIGLPTTVFNADPCETKSTLPTTASFPAGEGTFEAGLNIGNSLLIESYARVIRSQNGSWTMSGPDYKDVGGEASVPVVTDLTVGDPQEFGFSTDFDSEAEVLGTVTVNEADGQQAVDVSFVCIEQ